MTINVMGAMKWVRSNPRLFFGGREEPQPVHLLAYVMADIVELGKGDCVIRRASEWWVIGSDVDWLSGNIFSIVELFSQVVPVPTHGDHSMRGEILLGVFASDIVVLGTDGLIQVKGQRPGEVVLEKATDLRRSIIFRV